MIILNFNKKVLWIILVFILGLILVFSLLRFYKTDETFNMDIYYKGNVDKKTVAFACNVDWGNEYIEPMLKLFEDNNIKISFFITGKWAEKNPELLKLIFKKGHEIGNHGYNHIDYDKLDYQRNFEEISKAHMIIKKVLNHESILFAPPSGAYNDNTIKAAKDLGYDIIMWSIDTIDWRNDSYKDIIIKRVMDKIHNSAIVLMHPTEETLKALPDIILQLNNSGYKIVRVSDIIN
ncbi:MAG: polysaccharide deacetylase family protein [Tissierellia bacterium]|nr:polysaccharide deacetylase family protein [Tissierellia bacterium]